MEVGARPSCMMPLAHFTGVSGFRCILLMEKFSCLEKQNPNLWHVDASPKIQSASTYLHYLCFASAKYSEHGGDSIWVVTEIVLFLSPISDFSSDFKGPILCKIPFPTVLTIICASILSVNSP